MIFAMPAPFAVTIHHVTVSAFFEEDMFTALQGLQVAFHPCKVVQDCVKGSEAFESPEKVQRSVG